MDKQTLRHRSSRTDFIQLDTGKCKACWKCLQECRNNVIGRVDLPWHKHVIFVNSTNCTGCLRCISICDSVALINKENKVNDHTVSRKKLSPFLMNIGLLIFGVAMTFSGFLIQFNYHMGHTSKESLALGFNYYEWTDLHKISTVVLSFLMIYHVLHHSRWYKTVINKKLFARNKVLIILSVLFVLVAVTGYIPWYIDLKHGSELTRIIFIEIHDKLTIIFSTLLAVHVTMKLRWYFKFFVKEKSRVL